MKTIDMVSTSKKKKKKLKKLERTKSNSTRPSFHLNKFGIARVMKWSNCSVQHYSSKLVCRNFFPS